MLKMVIVDDEEYARKAVLKAIKWEALGINIIGEASNGQEGYELCINLKPDIVLSDIRMPVIDGIELAERIDREGLGCRVILLSGVQDFNYARAALDANVEGYLMKPLDSLEIETLFSKVKYSIELEKSNVNILEKAKKHFQEYLPVIRESFFRTLIMGEYKQIEYLADKLKALELDFRIEASYTVAVLEIDNYREWMAQKTGNEYQLLLFSIKNIVDEILRLSFNGYIFKTEENHFTIILEWGAKNKQEDLKSLFKEIQTSMQKLLNISVTIGVSDLIKGIYESGHAYHQALQTIKFKFYIGSGSVLFASDVSSDSGKDMGADYSDQSQQLMEAVKLGDTLGAREKLGNIFKSIKNYRGGTRDYVEGIAVELIYMLSRCIADMGDRIEAVLSPRNEVLSALSAKESLSDLHLYLDFLINKAAEHYADRYNQKNLKLVSKVKEIIDKKYKDDLSVNGIADSIGLTANYVSLLFSRATGRTITDYLTSVRLKASKELLRSTDFRVGEIAEMVGYEDANYFSKVFKKHTGMMPQKFRSASAIEEG
ncbi:MAG: response regulator [Clostridiaceae bacterium]|nr:response regulator [Clostridiaceae bacterium]